MIRKVFAVVAGVVMRAGCATTSSPSSSVVVYPAKGQTASQQQQDTGARNVWAKQNSGYDPAMETAKGAGIGAVVGGYKYVKSREGYDKAFGACMEGRGYTVK